MRQGVCACMWAVQKDESLISAQTLTIRTTDHLQAEMAVCFDLLGSDYVWPIDTDEIVVQV